MKYLVKWSMTDGMYEYYVVDQADDIDHAWEQFYDSFGDDFNMDIIEVHAMYELHLVDLPVALGERDTSCEVCGRPNCWPLCYDCERREQGWSHSGAL